MYLRGVKERAARILSSILVAVFVNFAFSNTVFLHTHYGLSGRAVTHSHPFLPSGNHGHTGQAFDLVAVFNAVAASAETAASPAIAPAPDCFVEINEAEVCLPMSLDSAPYGLRGPPFAG